MDPYTVPDAFAIPIWIFLIWDAAYSMRKGRKNIRVVLRLLIGIIGLIIDATFIILRPFG